MPIISDKPRFPAVGDKAPAFSLPDGDGGAVSSAKMKGEKFVLYFYPKDNTSGCTAEACDFRDNMARLAKLGFSVIGVSRDSAASHAKFAAKYDLGFRLAADVSGEICQKYGVWIEKSMYGKKYMGIERSTFLIDGKGVVRVAWRKVGVSGHVAEVIAAAERI